MLILWFTLRVTMQTLTQAAPLICCQDAKLRNDALHCNIVELRGSKAALDLMDNLPAKPFQVWISNIKGNPGILHQFVTAAYASNVRS